MILQSTSTDKGAKYIDESWNIRGNEPVWVKIGRLYVCMTITGETSWTELLNEPSVADTRSVLIFTARHGEVFGTLVDQTSGKVHDSHGKDGRKQVQEDSAICKKMRKEHPSIYLEVVDAFQGNLKNPDILREFTLGKLNSGNVVVWAWCNSLYSLQKVHCNASSTTGQNILKCQGNINLNETINSVVDRLFKWVPV